MEQKLKAAVIGAGAAGLVCARELVRQNIDVTIFEKSGQVGGVWVYESKVDDDITGVDPDQTVHTSLYDSLRTNLPRDLMAFSDYTFDSIGGGEDTWLRFPGHAQVLEYLERFSADHDLLKLIRFNAEVTCVRSADDPVRANTSSGLRTNNWAIESHDSQRRASHDLFDIVAVCNGHYSKPRVPVLNGIDKFSGHVIHSHNYRRPDEFKGKKVAVWGTAASGADIAREIASVASEVYWCGNTFELPPKRTHKGMHLYPSPVGFSGDDLVFNDEISISGVDAFVFCTGYEYNFPFLNEDVVSIDNNWVHPLYLDLISARHQNLAFIGLPFLVIPFRLFEMQSKWFASGVVGAMKFPSQEEMRQANEKVLQSFTKEQILRHHFHRLGDAQTDYINLLAAQCGADPVPEWFVGLALEAQSKRVADPEGFRSSPLKHQGPTVIRVDS
ncbi:MAG: thioredoxin reductase [Candidatus Azotimanducaceae bacterium]|jgi:thioredoxin reductase